MEKTYIVNGILVYLKEKKKVNELEKDIVSTIETYMQIPFDRDKGESKII